MGRSHTYDWVDSQHANTDVRNMHGSALTAVRARHFAVQLGHHAMYFDSLGDAVTMATVSRGNPICGLTCGACPYCTRLLAGIVVHGPNWDPSLDEPLQ